MKTPRTPRNVLIPVAGHLYIGTGIRRVEAKRLRLHRFRILLTMLIAATVLIVAHSAHGAIVFSHSPGPLSSIKTANSNALAHPDGSDQDTTTFDSFTLDRGATVTGVAWRGSASTPAMLGFTVSVYPSMPNAAAQADTGNPLVVLKVSGNANESKLNDRYSDYRTTFDTPLSLDAGVQYWISIVSDRSDLSPWGWAAGNGGDGKSIQAYTEFKVLPVPGDRTFTLDDGR